MKRIYWIIGILLIVVAAGGVIYYRQHREPKTEFREVRVARGDLQVSILSTGTVQPENRLEIKPPVAGRIDQVLVKEGDKIRKGQVLAWMSSTERAALMDAASSKGKEEVAQWEELYRPTPVLAPINGTLIARNVESGQTIATTEAILVMSDRLTVKAQVDETDIARIQLRQNADIVLDAYPENVIAAHVDQIAYDATTVNNVTTYVVDVLPEKTPDFMRSGMTANVTFHVSAKEGALLIPADAVKVVNGESVVTVKTDQGSEQRVIKTGLSEGKKVEVLEGLDEGDALLVPVFRLENKQNGGSALFGPPRRPRGNKAPKGP